MEIMLTSFPVRCMNEIEIILKFKNLSFCFCSFLFSFQLDFKLRSDCTSTRDCDAISIEENQNIASNEELESSPSLKSSANYIDTSSLVGLRGIATLHILISDYVGFISDVDLFGSVSVSLFLVLSAFILTIVYGQRVITMRSNPAAFHTFSKEFYIKRFARVIPMSYISFFFSIAIGIVSKSRLQFVLSWFFCTTWIGLAPFNYPAWTVSTLLFFYVCFPHMLRYIEKVNSLLKLLFFDCDG